MLRSLAGGLAIALIASLTGCPPAAQRGPLSPLSVAAYEHYLRGRAAYFEADYEGALVELEDGEGGKTLFMAPAGAGEELTGPGGDGFLHVVTPGSPIGKGLLGKKVGDVVEVMVKGELAEWDIVFAA